MSSGISSSGLRRRRGSRRRSAPARARPARRAWSAPAPRCPRVRIASRSAGRSSQPQRRGRPVTEPNSLPRLRSRSPVASRQLGRERPAADARRVPLGDAQHRVDRGRADARGRRRRRPPSPTTTSRTGTCRGRCPAARPARPRTSRCRRARSRRARASRRRRCTGAAPRRAPGSAPRSRSRRAPRRPARSSSGDSASIWRASCARKRSGCSRSPTRRPVRAALLS